MIDRDDPVRRRASEPQFRTRVHEPLREIERRATAAFPGKLAFRLFAQLGPA